MEEKKKRRISKPIIALSVVSILAIAASVFFYALYANTQSEASKQQKIVDKVAKTVELPGETPTVVTVADKDKLTNKQLAAKLDNGDVLLIFAEAKRLVVYRPGSEKVVNILSFANSAEVTPDAAAKTPVKH